MSPSSLEALLAIELRAHVRHHRRDATLENADLAYGEASDDLGVALPREGRERSIDSATERGRSDQHTGSAASSDAIQKPRRHELLDAATDLRCAAMEHRRKIVERRSG